MTIQELELDLNKERAYSSGWTCVPIGTFETEKRRSSDPVASQDLLVKGTKFLAVNGAFAQHIFRDDAKGKEIVRRFRKEHETLH